MAIRGNNFMCFIDFKFKVWGVGCKGKYTIHPKPHTLSTSTKIIMIFLILLKTLHLFFLCILYICCPK